MLAEAGEAVEGLRIAGGVLMLKVESDGAAVRVRVTGDGLLMTGGDVWLRRADSHHRATNCR